MKVNELKAALEERGLDTKGLKKDLAARLLEALVTPPPEAKGSGEVFKEPAATEAVSEEPAEPATETAGEVAEVAMEPTGAPPAEEAEAEGDAPPAAGEEDKAPAAAAEALGGAAPLAEGSESAEASPAGIEGLRGEVTRLRQQHHELNTLVSQWYHSVMQLQQQLQRPPPMMPQQGYGYPPPGYGGPPPMQQQAPPPQQTSPWTEHFTPEGHTYYYNAMTGASSWERPPDYMGGKRGGGGGGGGSGGGTKQKGPPGANLFVVRKMRRGEYDDFDDAQLRDAFSRFGALLRAEITLDKDTGISKGFGFVSFTTAEEADAAMASMNGAMIGGRQIRIEKSST
jgi:hypothetical protein